jgi:anti-sigma factor ChrR (cupin superfamily)
VPGLYVFSCHTSLLHLYDTGWTILDKLYIYKGVVYIVTDQPSTIPDLRFIYSKGIWVQPGVESEPLRLPTEKDIRVISSKQAKQLFGTSIQTIDDITVRFTL